MTSTPKSLGDDSLSESWVDLSISPGRLTPVALSTISLVNSGNGAQMSQSAYALTLAGEEYLRMLRDAQRESNHSSARVSLASSRRDSRCESPKSPPNSPNTELSNGEDELQGIFINKQEVESTKGKDWILTYLATRCDAKKYDGMKPKVTITSKANLSLRTTKFAGKSLFSKEVMYTLFVSNFLSLIIGAGIGLWLSKRSSVISQFPIN